MATIFDRFLGSDAGRIAPAGWTPPDGSWVLALGADTPGRVGRLASGDFVQASQTADITGYKLLRYRYRLRGTGAALPAGARWRASVRMGAQVHATQTLTPGRTVDGLDGAFVLVSVSGNQQLTFSLEVEGLTGDQEVEIPAFYVDALVHESTPARAVLVNRSPEPAAVDVPRDTPIRVSIVDTDGPAGGVNLASVLVYVNGVLAYSGGSGFQPGFDSVTSAVLSFSGAHRVIYIVPTFLFDSEQAITVRVVAASSAGAPWVLDQSYGFTIVDETPPRVVGAQALDLARVRVSFNEPMKLVDPTVEDDALNPARWSLVPLDLPAFVPAVESVSIVASTAVDLTFSEELSPGVRYEVRCLGAVDLFGNAMSAPLNRATITGAQPPQPEGRVFDLWAMLTKKHRRDDPTGDRRKFIACLQEVATLLLASVDRFATIRDTSAAPEWAIDLLLIELGNPFRFALSLTDKRRLLGVLVPLYREKGTTPGIANALRFFLGLDPVEVIPFSASGFSLGDAELGAPDPDAWELGPAYGFNTYAFDLVVHRVLTDDERANLREIVEYMKPAHTHFVTLHEPTVPISPDHVELGLSELGPEFDLHGPPP